MKYPLLHYLFGFEYVFIDTALYSFRVRRMRRIGKLYFVRNWGEWCMLREKGKVETQSTVKRWLPVTPNTEIFWNEGYLLDNPPDQGEKETK